MFYRESIHSDYSLINISYNFTDGLAGIKQWGPDNEEVTKKSILNTIRQAYSELDTIIGEYPEFETSFKPVSAVSQSPMISKMLDFSTEAGVGPMAGVAGAVSEAVTDSLKKRFSNCFFENGGDISLVSETDTKLAIFPGWNGFETKVHLKIPEGTWGIASSSGKYGRSFSLGQADMVTVVDRSPVKADMFATAIANQISDSVNPSELITDFNFLNAVAIVQDGIFYYKGEFELC